MINVNKIEELLEREFEFLINDFGYTLDKYVYLTEIYLTYSTKKREIHILYDGINHGFYVNLTNMGIIGNLCFGREGELGFNIETITNGNMKREDIDQYLISEASSDIKLDLIKLYKRIMLDYLHEVLLSKKWIRLK